MCELLNTGVNISLEYYAAHDALIGQVKGYSVAVKENLSTGSYGCLFWLKKGEFGALTTVEQYLEDQQKKNPEFLKKFMVNETGVAVALNRTSDDFTNINNLKRFIYDFTSALSLNNYVNCCCECGSSENLSIYDTEGAIAQACSVCGAKYVFICTCKNTGAMSVPAPQKIPAPVAKAAEPEVEKHPEPEAEKLPESEAEKLPESEVENASESVEEIAAEAEEKLDTLLAELEYKPEEKKEEPVAVVPAPVTEEFSLKEFEFDPAEKVEEETPVKKEEEPADLSSLMYDETEKVEEAPVQEPVPVKSEEPAESFGSLLYEEAAPEPERPRSKLFEEAEREFAEEKARRAAEEAKADEAVDDLLITNGEIVLREITPEVDDGSHDVTEVYDDSNDGEDFDIEEIESTVEMPTVTTGHPQLEAEETPLEEDGSVPLINPNSHREERHVSAVDGPDAVQPLDYGQAHVTYEKLTDETAPRFSAGGEMNRGYGTTAPPPYNPDMNYSSYTRVVKSTEKSNALMGIIGALVVGLVGLALWIILGHVLNVIHSFGCVAIILTVYGGYYLGGRALDKKGIVISFILTFAMVIAGVFGISMFNVQKAFADEYGISMTLKQALDWTIAVLEIDSFKADFMANMAISMAATFIGNIIAAVSFWRKAA